MWIFGRCPNRKEFVDSDNCPNRARVGKRVEGNQGPVAWTAACLSSTPLRYWLRSAAWCQPEWKGEKSALATTWWKKACTWQPAHALAHGNVSPDLALTWSHPHLLCYVEIYRKINRFFFKILEIQNWNWRDLTNFRPISQHKSIIVTFTRFPDFTPLALACGCADLLNFLWIRPWVSNVKTPWVWVFESRVSKTYQQHKKLRL